MSVQGRSGERTIARHGGPAALLVRDEGRPLRRGGLVTGLAVLRLVKDALLAQHGRVHALEHGGELHGPAQRL